MDAATARRVLTDTGFACSRVEPVAEQGWDSFVFEVDGRYIARFPRSDEVRRAHERERRILPSLAAHVSFRVPLPLHDDVFVYERLPGRPLQRGDDIDAALAMIDELHTFPVTEAERLLGARSWDVQLAEEWATFEAEAFPFLDNALAAAVTAVREPLCADVALIHYDLGCEHVLVSADGAPVGIIDFEDVTVGDPEADRMPTYVLAGRHLTERMWAFHCRGTLHALVYYAREGRSEEIPAAVAELRTRLAHRPGG